MRSWTRLMVIRIRLLFSIFILHFVLFRTKLSKSFRTCPFPVSSEVTNSSLIYLTRWTRDLWNILFLLFDPEISKSQPGGVFEIENFGIEVGPFFWLILLARWTSSTRPDLRLRSKWRWTSSRSRPGPRAQLASKASKTFGSCTEQTLSLLRTSLTPAGPWPR